MAQVMTFGEIMLRLSPKEHYRLFQNQEMEAVFGGGEANVAVSLSNLGIDAGFVSKLPQGPVGDGAIQALKRYGVDTSRVLRGGKRVGIYFCEKGASQRPSVVVYDREGSAVSEAKSEEYDWAGVFDGCSWFHFTGITPALSKNAAESTLEACRTAKKKGVKISCDINYRKKLWTEEQAEKVMSELMGYVDVCIANEEDAANVFGIRADNSDVEKGELDKAGYKKVAEEICSRFGCQAAAVTLRKSYSSSDNGWGAMLYTGGAAYFSKEYRVHIVDRVGGGDSFGAGLIYGLLNNMKPQDAVEFAAAASCLKHTIHGDFNIVSLQDVKNLLELGEGGRIQR